MPPCYCTDFSLLHKFNVGNMRSNASDPDHKLKTIKTCISKNSSFLQKAVLSPNPSSLFTVPSVSSPCHTSFTVPSVSSPCHTSVSSPCHTSNFTQINEMHDFNSMMLERSTSKHIVSTKPATKLTLPAISIPSCRTISSAKQSSSPIFTPSHTITKPASNFEINVLKHDEPSREKANEKTPMLNFLKYKNCTSCPQIPTCLPVINTFPKLYSMITNNSRKTDKSNIAINKTRIIGKKNREKTTRKEKAVTSVVNSSKLCPSTQDDIISSMESLQRINEGDKHNENILLLEERLTEKRRHAIINSSASQGNHLLTSSSMNVSSPPSQPSQTLLLALPENFNVNQFSNQTLNLDLNSQHILRELLQPSMGNTEPSIERESEEMRKEDNAVFSSALMKEGVSYHNLPNTIPTQSATKEHANVTSEKVLSTGKHYLTNSSQPSSQTNNEVEQMSTFPSSPREMSEINSNISNEQLFTKINPNKIENDLLPISNVGERSSPSNIEVDNVNRIEIDISTHATDEIDISTHATDEIGISTHSTDEINISTHVTDKIDIQTHAKSEIGISTNEIDMHGNVETQGNDNPLPVAAINVDMIDGQPMYTIQIMGQYIPLAAITIPTSEGPLHLQSANARLPSQPLASKGTESTLVNEPSVTFADTNKVVTTVPLSTRERNLRCRECGKLFQNADALTVHQLIHAEEKLHLCKVAGCEKCFANASALKIHQRVHQEGKPFKCISSGCSKAFKTPSELARHQFRHTGEKPYKCDKCEKAFVRNDDLKRHYFIHTGQKRFHCDQCNFSCIQSFDLVKHRYIHGGEKPYKCTVCPKQFTRPARLREHQRLHTGERPYTCDECGKTFTQLTSLKSHKLAHGEKPIPCDKCEKSFTNDTEYQEHLNSHTGIKAFQCNICDRHFVSAKTLKRHAVVHTGEKAFECQVCKKKFARPSDLKVHMLVHDANKPYQCSECLKMFTRYSSLKEHHRLHTGEYPFQCGICDHTFNHRSHLNVHMRTHTGEKPHKCHICPKEFSRKLNLKLHLKHHGITGDADVNINVVDVEEGEEDDISDTDMDGRHSVELDAAQITILKTIQNVLKRKRDESFDNSEELLKRHIAEDAITDYTEQVLKNLNNEQPHLQVGEVTVVGTLSSLLQSEKQVTELTTEQLTPLTENIINNDDGAVVALNLVDYQTPEQNLVVSNLIELNQLETVQCVDTHSFVMKQQHEHIEEIADWQDER